jgi:hypothetical protein
MGDSLVSVEYSKFAGAVRAKTEAMRQSIVKLSTSVKRFVCTNNKCPNSKTSMSLIDVVSRSVATHALVCPRRGCTGSAVESVGDFSGMTFEQATDFNRSVHTRIGALARLIREGCAYMDCCADTAGMTAAGAQLAGCPHPVTPLPDETVHTPIAEHKTQPCTSQPEFLVSKRMLCIDKLEQPRTKRTRTAEVAPETSEPDRDEPRQLCQPGASTGHDTASGSCTEQWVVQGRAYQSEELTDALVSLMTQAEAERYAAWYAEKTDTGVLFDPDS